MRSPFDTRRRWNRPVVIALALSLAGCNSEVLFHGAKLTDGGAIMSVASLMPSCSCMTISAKQQTGDVVVISRRHGIETGRFLLRPGEPRRFRFDWAGSTNADVYHMSAYSPVNGAPGQQLTPVDDYIKFEEDLVDVPCASQSCPFGLLNMNQAYAEQLGQAGTENYAVGSSFIRGGKAIVLNTPAGTCGCVMLRNTSRTAIELRSSLHGRNGGKLTFPAGATLGIGFDFAGDNPDDVYLLEATPVGAQRSVREDESGKVAGALSASIADFVTMYGQFDGLSCPLDARAPNAAVAVTVNGTTSICPFGDLRMNERAAQAQAAADDGTPPAAATVAEKDRP